MLGIGKTSKLARASRTVPKEARTPAARVKVMKRTDLEKLVQEGSEASPEVQKAARARLRELDKIDAMEDALRRAKGSGSKNVDLPKLKSEKDMNKGGAVKKAQMMRGGMANKKEHMYAAGGSVMDNLTSAQKNMVKKMAAANKNK
tara:strand:+ start:199 stop:636 length:438 start_codon:yes stop_codon:yes gene_type:complete